MSCRDDSTSTLFPISYEGVKIMCELFSEEANKKLIAFLTENQQEFSHPL